MINMQDSLDVSNCLPGIFLFHVICVWVDHVPCHLNVGWNNVWGKTNLVVRLGAKYLYTLSHPSLPVPRNLGGVACL